MTQQSLVSLGDISQKLLATMTTSTSGMVNNSVVRGAAKAALDSATSILNGSINGEYLFAGVNTDIKPINDFGNANSPSRMALADSFTAHFGFAHTAPEAAGISADALMAYVNDVVEPQFLGSGWEAAWSNAADQRIVSRITLTETAPTSIGANAPAIRKLAMAAATVSFLLEGPIGSDASKAVMEKATGLLAEATANFGDHQGEIGIIQQRVSRATERVTMQIDLFSRSRLDLEGVDPYEAATRLSGLMAQIEMSYTLTARLQQLSLLRYL
jgi:flagellar hook-associated protein 3 FlgL